MPATSSYSPTGLLIDGIQIDGILMGTKWATTTLTYSFPTSASYYGSRYGDREPNSGFEAFNAQQQSWIQTVLKNYSDVAKLTFLQVTESSSVHGDLRYAMSNVPGTAWGYYPSTSATGGDMWFNNSSGWYDAPLKGNYAALTMLHETGHALGLKHPHETSGSFPAETLAYDSLEYTVMSYRSYVGGPTEGSYSNADDSYPQTLMMLDIAAIQQLYGANYTTHNEDTTYSWDPVTGRETINGVADTAMLAGNKIFLTIWDGGGNDTYDFSNYATALKVDLQPGHWTTVSADQLAILDTSTGKTAVGNIANALLYQNNAASLIENAIGGSGNDTIVGNAANNVLTGGGGNDSIDGLGGTNTAVYAGKQSEYVVTDNGDGTWTVADSVAGRDGVDTLTNIQQLRFSDGLSVLDGVAVVTPPVVVNTAPVAANDAYQVVRNGKITISAAGGVLHNDSDAQGNTLTVSLVSGVSRGTLTLNADGSFTYTAPRNYSGTVTFKYKDSDGLLTSNTATVSIKVGASSNSSGGKGGGASEDPANDQMPAAQSLVQNNELFGTNDRFDHSAWRGGHGGVMAPADGGPGAHLLAQLDATVSHLGGPPPGLPLGVFDGGHEADLVDLTGLPDLLHRCYSEFAPV